MSSPETDTPSVPLEFLQSVIDHHSQPLKPVSVPKAGKPIASGAVMEGPFHPSPSLDSKNIEEIEGFDEFRGYLSGAQSVMSLATISLTEINTARQQAAKNQVWHPHQALLFVAKFAEEKRDRVHKAFDRECNNLVAAAEALENQLSTPLEQQASAGNSVPSEIRDHFKKLEHNARTKESLINSRIWH